MIVRKSFIAILLLTAVALPTLMLLLRASPHAAGSALGESTIQTEHAPNRLNEEGLFSVLTIPKAYAQGGGPGMAAAMHSGSSSLESMAQKFFSKTLEVFVVLNWFALMAVQTLLDVDAIFGPPDASGIRPMEQILNPLWILSRNIANALFAFILLIGGVYLIVSAEGAETFVKQRMPKFILAVVLVNFSWFFPRVIIDASHVLTSVIFQIPMLVNQNLVCVGGPGDDGDIDTLPGATSVHPDDEACRYVQRVVLFPTMNKKCDPNLGVLPVSCNPPTSPNGRRIADFVWIYWTGWKSAIQSGVDHDGDTTTVNVPISGADAVVNGLAVNFAKIPNLGVIDFQNLVVGNSQQTLAQRTAGYAQFFMHLVLNVVLSVAVGLALLAFAVVLVVRMGILWLCIAFMPFVFVPFAMGKPLGELGQEAGGINIWKKFLSYALLPALVAIPFAVGFTLVSQLYYMQSAFPRVAILQNLPFVQGIDDFHHILWMIISVAIIWKGVFMVLESKDDFAKSITGAIKGVGTTGMRIVTQSVGYAPIIPTPGGGKGLFDVRDELRGMAAGKGVVPMFRPPGPPPPPPDTGKVQAAVQGLGPTAVNDLKKVLQNFERNVTARNAPHQLEELARDLRRIIPSLKPEEARGIVSNQESLKHFLTNSVTKRVVTQTEADSIMTKLGEHFGKASTGLPEIKVSSLTGGKPPEQQVAEQVANTLKTTTLTPQQLQQAVENGHKYALDAHKKAFEDVLNEMKKGGTNMRERMDAMANGQPPPPPTT